MAGDDGDGSSSNDSEAPPPRRGLTARKEKDPDRGGAGGPGKQQKVRRTQSMNLEYAHGDQEDAGNTKEHSDQLVNALLGNPNDSGVGRK